MIRGEQSPDARGAMRLQLRLETEAGGDPGAGTRVVIHNMSATGLLIETRAPLAIGEQIVVHLPEAGAVAALTVWRSEALYGCRFLEPLGQAALSAAQLRNPIPAGFDPLDGASTPEPLPVRLRRLREERGVSLAALARRAGFSKPSLWAWENGRTIPRPQSLRALARALDVPEALLAPGAGWPPLAAVSADSPASRDLRAIVEASKTQIARAVGIDPARVSIRIDL